MEQDSNSNIYLEVSLLKKKGVIIILWNVVVVFSGKRGVYDRWKVTYASKQIRINNSALHKSHFWDRFIIPPLYVFVLQFVLFPLRFNVFLASLISRRAMNHSRYPGEISLPLVLIAVKCIKI